jgi:hypothetical protein
MKKLLFVCSLVFVISVSAQKQVGPPPYIYKPDTCIVVKKNSKDIKEKGTTICYRKNQIIFWRVRSGIWPPPNVNLI